MTEIEKLRRIEVYESLGLSQDEMEWRLQKDEHLDSDNWWELVRDQKFRKPSEIPDDEWKDLAWEYTSLEEELVTKSYDPTLTESKKVWELNPGDIVLVSRFTNQFGDNVDNSDHRLVVVGDDGKNNTDNRTYFGYYMSSQKEKSNKYNKKFPKNIYINNYNTILQRGLRSNQSEVFVCIIGVSEFSQKDIVNVVGHVTPEFEAFLKDTVKKAFKKEDTSEVYWEK